MDLVADAYLVLHPASGMLWDELVAGASQERLLLLARELDDEDPVALVTAQLEAWREAGLLASGEGPPRLPSARAAGGPAPRELDQQRIASSAFSLGAALRLVYSSLHVRRALRRSGLVEVLLELQSVRASGSGSAVEGSAAEGAICAMVRAYQLLRMPYHAGQPDCLPRSLALARALRGAGIDAEVCIGAVRYPFAAHAWVECGGVLINERVATVAPYTVLARF
jgi:hypothetical protein